MFRERTSITSDDGSFRLVRLTSQPTARHTLVCFPFAGGGPLAFAPLARALGDDWTTWAVDPPGHVRTRGEPLRSVEAMVDLYLARIPREVLDGAWLFGHSLGANVAFAMAQRLEATGRVCAGVVASGSRPPHRRQARPLAKMDDEELFDHLLGLGGLFGSVAEQRAFFELYKDPIRADLEAFDEFVPAPRPLTQTRLKILGTYADPIAPSAELAEWDRYGTDVSVATFEGGHLFVVDAPAKVAAEVQAFARGARDAAAVA